MASRSRAVARAESNFETILSSEGLRAANVDAMLRQQIQDAWRRVILARRASEANRYANSATAELNERRATEAFADLAAKALGLMQEDGE